jgi:hypothetical protein
LLDGAAGPAKLDLPVLGFTMRSSERLRRRRGPRKAPCETPSELLDGAAGPAKLDLPVLGFTMRSSEEMKNSFERRHFDGSKLGAVAVIPASFLR